MNKMIMKELLSKVAKFYGHSLIFYKKPKCGAVGEYDGIQIFVSRDVKNE